MQLQQKIRENPVDKEKLSVWRIEYSAFEHEAASILALLDTEEKRRQGNYKLPEKALAYAVAHAFMRLFFAEMLHLPPHELRFLQGSYGKPYLAQAPHLAFNLSYSSPFLLFACAREGQLGVDIEAIKPRPNMLSILEQFHPEEKAALLRLETHQQLRQFYRLWTCKEAYIKALGMGLSLPLNSFAVHLGHPAFIHGQREWLLHELSIGEGHCATVATNSSKTLQFLQI